MKVLPARRAKGAAAAAGPGDAPALCVEDLRVTVGGEQPYDIVDGVSLDVAAGEVLGLVGESGSGKTTLALALLAFARPGTSISSGSVRVDGVELLGRTGAERRRARGTLISYVPQDPTTSLNPVLRIGLQLTETLRAHGREDNADERIAAMLERVQLPSTREFLKRYPHQLSGGQQQRVCIAMAAICRPRVIVLDEPTTGLDVTTQGHVLDMLRELIATDGTAAVYVTHDLAVAAGLANRFAVMYSGMLVEEGPAEAIVAAAAHPYTRRLLLATPSVRQRRGLSGIPGTPLDPRDREDACPFAPRCELATPECSASLPELVGVAAGHRSRCVQAAAVRGGARAAGAAATASVWDDHGARGDAPLLSVRGLRAFHGERTILHEIDLEISRGECVAVVGETGSGKTTLARCISGLHSGTAEGTITFDGVEVALDSSRRSAAARRAIQYIFQNPYGSLNPRHTIGHSVALPFDVFGIHESARRRAHVRELLERVSLNPTYEERYPDQLSGGERQRVAIARALAADPQLLICDEVTSSLDVSIQASILELLGRLRRELDLTIVFITHHLALVRAIADRIVIVRDGRFVEAGPAATVLDHPREPYTVELLANTPVLVGEEA